MKHIYRAIDGKEFNTEIDCIIHEKELKEAEALKQIKNNKDAEEKYFEKLGYEGNNNQWIKFDRLGNYMGVAEIGKDFKDFEELNKAFIKDNVYGFSLCTFKGRSKEWYDMPLIDKIENLCWLKTKIFDTEVLADVWGAEKSRKYTIKKDGKHSTFTAKNKDDARKMITAVGIKEYEFV